MHYSAYAYSVSEGAWGCEQGRNRVVLVRDERKLSLALRHMLAVRARHILYNTAGE